MTNKPFLRPTFAFILLIACLVLTHTPTLAQAPANGITAPAEGATVAGMVEISGVAADPAFEKWQLDLLLEGKPHKATVLAVGTGQIPAPATLTRFDSAPYANGHHRLRLRVVRNDGNYDEYFSAITLANPAAAGVTAATDPVAAAGPANGIFSPQAGERVKGTVRIRGVAADADFLKWQLDLLPGGDSKQAFLIATSRTPADDERNLGAVDTRYFANGQHVLRLRVVRRDSNFDEYLLPIIAANPGAPLPRPVAENGFTAPKKNARVEGVLEIHGVAQTDDFSKWQIDVLVNGDPAQAVLVATGRRAVPASATMARFNSKRIPNGEHVLRLRVVGSDGNYQEYLQPIRVENRE